MTQLSQVQLTNEEDKIIWRFKKDGCYTAQSAYNVQFIGAITEKRWGIFWKAKVEQKCRFFIWLLLQFRLPTADRIIRRGDQANPICTLCNTTTESHFHMVVNCTYAQAVWQRVAAWLNIQLRTQNAATMGRWWKLITKADAANKDNQLQVVIYTVWNIWKERCRRFFFKQSNLF
jgi:hypothetical protein